MIHLAEDGVLTQLFTGSGIIGLFLFSGHYMEGEYVSTILFSFLGGGIAPPGSPAGYYRPTE
jgi:hypothetical protein